MEAQQKVEVKLISTEFVKPSFPTPSSHKFFTLSYLDISFPAIHLPFHLVYANSTTVATQLNVDIIPTLKTALAETLTTFYPLAGRCIDDYTVSCDDQGVLFIETRVDCRLSDVLNSPRKLDLFGEFLPPISLDSKHISEFIPLSFQINIFKCGGIVISCYFFHKLLDAASLSCFINHWAAIADNRCDGLVKPNFKAALAVFPPPPKVEEHATATLKSGASREDMVKLWNRLKSIKVVGKSFVFSRIVIDELKGKAVTKTLPNPTAFEVVAGFVWKNIMAASGVVATTPNKEQPVTPTVLSFSLNIRPRSTPPFPKESMGNLVVDVHACADKCGELSDHAAEIHRSILTMAKKIEAMQGENGKRGFLAEREAVYQGFGEDSEATTYHLTSWCRLGFNEVNFGFGNPSSLIPVGKPHPFSVNNIRFLDYSDSNGDGIEVWLFLDEKEMQILESNEQFRAFASSSC